MPTTIVVVGVLYGAAAMNYVHRRQPLPLVKCPLCKQEVYALWTINDGVPLDPARCSACVKWTTSPR